MTFNKETNRDEGPPREAATLPLENQSSKILVEIHGTLERILLTISLLARRSGKQTAFLAELMNPGHFRMEELFETIYFSEIIADSVGGVKIYTPIDPDVRYSALERSYAQTVQERALFSCYAFDNEKQSAGVVFRSCTGCDQHKVKTMYVAERCGRELFLFMYQEVDHRWECVFKSQSGNEGGQKDLSLSQLYEMLTDVKLLDAQMKEILERVSQ